MSALRAARVRDGSARARSALRVAIAGTMAIATLALSIVASGAPPDGYKCGAGGKPVAGAGCACPAGKVDARDKENDAICVDAPVSAPKPAATTGTTSAPTSKPPPVLVSKPPPVLVSKPPPPSDLPRSPPFAASAVAAPPSLRPTLRSRSMIVEEIAALQKVLDAEPSEHAVVSRRLADVYEIVETYQIEVVAPLANRPTKAAEYAKERATYEGYRQHAIIALQSIQERDPNDPKLDEALYALAEEHDALRVFEKSSSTELQEASAEEELGRQAYFELIKDRPSSSYASWAYVAFGDVFFDDAVAGRVSWDLARDAYQKAIALGPTNGAYGYAQDRLGFTAWHLDDAKAARAAFGHAVDWTKKYPDAPSAADVGAEAKRALAVI